jgi:hypothetical protein
VRREIIVGAAFALSLAIMPWVYDLLWYAHPDYFRVQSGVNVLPTELFSIAREYSAYKEDPPLPPMIEQTQQDEAAAKIFSLYRQFQTTSVLLSEKQAELKKRRVADEGEYRSFAASEFDQLERFVASKALVFQPEIKRLTDAMHLILTQAGVATSEKLPPGSQAVTYANFAVDLARTQLKLSQAQLEARMYALSNLTEFQKLPSQQEYLTHHQQIAALERELADLRGSTNQLHGKLYDAFLAYRTAALRTLGYWDFFYFSVGAATTATFGDIAPNSEVVRILICIQVLGSILGTGIIVSGLTKDRTGRS